MEENYYNFVGLLTSIQHIMNKRFNSHLEQMDLTVTQLNVLIFVIDSYGSEINQRDIERGFHLTNPTVTGILKRLEAKGFVKRVTSQSDARSKIITATDYAVEIYKRMDGCHISMENMLMSEFTDEEKETFWNLLNKFHSGISSMENVELCGNAGHFRKMTDTDRNKLKGETKGND